MSRLQRTLEYYHNQNQPFRASTEIKNLSVLSEFKVLFIIDDKRTILYSKNYLNHPLESKFLKDTLNKLALDSAINNYRSTILHYKNKTSFFAYYPITLAPLKNEFRSSRVGSIILEYDLSEKQSRILNQTLSNSFWFVLIALASVASIIYLFRLKLILPIKHLSNVATIMQNGDFTCTANIEGKGELAELAHCFNKMSQQVSENIKSIKESQLRFQAVIENTPNLISIKDLSCRYLMANKQAQATFGEHATDYLKKTTKDVHSGIEGEKIQAIEKYVIKTGELSTYHENWPKKNGEPTHYLAVCFPLKNEANEIYAICTIATDLTLYKKALKSAAEAETESEAKSNFLATMSHEIRTPLSGIIGTADLLLDSPLNDDQKELLNTLTVSGEALLIVLNDILDYSKIRSNKLQLHIEPFSPYDVIENCSNLYQQQMHLRNVRFQKKISPSFKKMFLGDPWRLRQIVLNLLSNAVKFTSKGNIILDAKYVRP